MPHCDGSRRAAATVRPLHLIDFWTALPGDRRL